MTDDEIGRHRFLTVSVALTAVMLACAAGIGSFTGVGGALVFLPYLGAWASLTLIAVLLWFFAQVAALAPKRADRPLQIVMACFRARDKQALWVSGLIFPLFLGAYTWAKCSIPLAVGYKWESFWADADRSMFGVDAWRLAHAWMPPATAPTWTFFYAVVWGFALCAVGALVAAFGRSRFAATMFTAMMFAWLSGGFLLAYSVSAAGPVFAQLADPAFAERFAPLRASLIELLGRDDIVLTSQRYLAAGYGAKVAVKGGGLSAMPSMHIATATIFVCAAWRTGWLALAVPFWILTFFGSVYLGYHYAIDAPVAVAVAVFCWIAARRIYRITDESSAAREPVSERPAADQGRRR
jgi:hypothetical protein